MEIKLSFVVILSVIAAIMAICGASVLTIGITVAAIFVVANLITYALGLLLEAAVRAMFAAAFHSEEETEA